METKEVFTRATLSELALLRWFSIGQLLEHSWDWSNLPTVSIPKAERLSHWTHKQVYGGRRRYSRPPLVSTKIKKAYHGQITFSTVASCMSATETTSVTEHDTNDVVSTGWVPFHHKVLCAGFQWFAPSIIFRLPFCSKICDTEWGRRSRIGLESLWKISAWNLKIWIFFHVPSFYIKHTWISHCILNNP